jgi:mycothiol synthase
VSVPEPSIPQLRLGFTRFAALEPPVVPAGYGLRNFRPGDEDAWIAVLSTAAFGEWDRARLDRLLSGERSIMPYEGIWFATRDDVPVGGLCTFFYRREAAPAAEIGWVAVVPEHRGRGLAGAMCTAALRFIHAQGVPYAFLKTEDYRVTAINLYLRLGFEPEMVAPEHADWWREFLAGA